MKNHFSFFGMAIVALTTVFLTGCDKVDDLSDFTFHSEFEESVPMKDESTGENKDYSQIIVIDATNDAEIKRYESKIKSFSVEKLTYKIDNSADTELSKGVTFTGKMGFSDKEATGTPTVLATINGLKLDDNTTEHEVELAQADLDKLAGYLKDKKAVKISLTGKISKTPINIVVNVKIKVAVTSNVL